MKQLYNRFKTVLLLGTLTGIFVLIGAAIGGRTGMMIAFTLAITMNMGAWWFSDRIALRMSSAREVMPAEAPELHRLVDRLAQRAQIPTPRVYMIDSETPNAFATGRTPSKGAVAVTTGLVRMLNTQELAGVIAHELAHIKHRDTLIASVAATIAGAVAMLADIVMWGMIFGGFGDEEEDGGIAGLAGGLVTLILAPIGALLIQLAISRSREFSADAAGAEILGDPLPLASALEKLENAVRQKPAEMQPAAAHLFIINPVLGGIGALFRTHPSTEKRAAALRAMIDGDAVAAPTMTFAN